MIIATIAIKSDKIAPNKNIRGKMSRRNLELFSGPKDENAEGDAKAIKNTIELIRAEQRKISIGYSKKVYVPFVVSFKNGRYSLLERKIILIV